MYQYKTNWELFRSLLILKTCSFNFFVENSLTVSMLNLNYLLLRSSEAIIITLLNYSGLQKGDEHTKCLGRSKNKMLHTKPSVNILRLLFKRESGED